MKAPGETVETSGVPSRLLDVQVRLGRLTQNLEGEDRVLTQEAELSVLYETEEGPARASRRVSLSHRLPGQGRDLPGDHRASAGPHPLPWQEGVEVSFALAFRVDVPDPGGGPCHHPGPSGGNPGRPKAASPSSPSGRSTPGRICGQWPKPALHHRGRHPGRKRLGERGGGAGTDAADPSDGPLTARTLWIAAVSSGII